MKIKPLKNSEVKLLHPLSSYLVRLVKEQLGMHTLAIGDGANDVSMIQVMNWSGVCSGHCCGCAK